jgi:hypothetical protein
VWRSGVVGEGSQGGSELCSCVVSCETDKRVA